MNAKRPTRQVSTAWGVDGLDFGSALTSREISRPTRSDFTPYRDHLAFGQYVTSNLDSLPMQFRETPYLSAFVLA